MGAFRRHFLEAVAPRKTGIGFSIGDVHAELAFFGHDRLAAHRVIAELAQRRFWRSAAAVLARGRKQRKGLFYGNVEELFFAGERAAFLALRDVRAITAILCGDRHAVSRINADHPRQR